MCVAVSADDTNSSVLWKEEGEKRNEKHERSKKVLFRNGQSEEKPLRSRQAKQKSCVARHEHLAMQESKKQEVFLSKGWNQSELWSSCIVADWGMS